MKESASSPILSKEMLDEASLSLSANGAYGSTAIGNLPTVAGDTIYSVREAQHPSLSRGSSSGTSLDNLYHRILDNNEFDKLTSPSRANAGNRRGPPDVPPSRTKTKASRSRPVELENASTPPSSGPVVSRLPTFQAKPDHYGQSKLVNQFSDRYGALAPSVYTVRHRRSVDDEHDKSSRAATSDPSPAGVQGGPGASLKASHLEQASNARVPFQHFKTDQPHRYRQELAVSTSSTTVAPAGRSAAPSAAITSASPSTREPSFILLDDSIYISPPHAAPEPSGPNGTARHDRLGDLADAVFGGRNFDEQIIFLNGPDLLDSSIEQGGRVGAGGSRQMGKVARAAATSGGDGWMDGEEELFEEPLALPLRPIARDPTEAQLAEDNVVLVYADQHETVRLNCEVDADITSSVWLKDGQLVHAMDKKSRPTDIRFVRESFGALTITNVMLEDDGMWQCEAENARGFFFNGRPIKLIVLDPPKAPYLLIDSRRLDASNMFIPAKENAELTLACVSEGGNPKPMLSWEVLLSPGIDRHAQKLSTDLLELQEIKPEKDKDKEPYRINSGAVSEAKLPAVYRVHHNARILCIMEHPTLKVRQNASILLDVQYTPSFAITRTPGFGYPLREGIEVSLKCDVDSNPPSTPVWQKDDGDTPVPQIGDGFLNFSSIRREHSGWYKCTSRHLNFQYSSIGYYLSVRYDPVDVTSEPVEQDLSLSPHSPSSSSSSASSAASSSGGSYSSSSASVVGGGSGASSSLNGASLAGGGVAIGTHPFKGGQMEVELGGSVTLQCPQGSLGCWSHLDSATVRMKGPGSGGFSSYGPAGQLSLKDVVYQDAGTYKCVGHQPIPTTSTGSSSSSSGSRNQSHQGPLQTVSLAVKGKRN
uniref:Ig-like domain-containing protein n=1 Tax=Anopheles albimanus TaxID=7167 RepID=A0A182FW09_ANOAL